MLKNGQEVIIGIKQDPQFGPAVLFGSGGTDVELYKDIETAIAPLCQLEAERLVDSTIAGKKLQGWRNLLPGDRKAVIDILLKMSFIAHYHPEISEMEINPLYVMENGSGAYAVDVRGNLEK
jgi:acetyltransferase